ncbi:hypothetical protein [Flexivirga alba]|uniref:Uncharacterized protein n=1 Tax=Flexivirga alba TaxID=702742 RepID=A0ABW2AKD8_9MICO
MAVLLDHQHLFGSGLTAHRHHRHCSGMTHEVSRHMATRTELNILGDDVPDPPLVYDSGRRHRLRIDPVRNRR